MTKNFFKDFYNDFDRSQNLFCKVVVKSRRKDFAAKVSSLQPLKMLINRTY